MNMEHLLISLKTCTCRYHKVICWNPASFEGIENDIRNIIVILEVSSEINDSIFDTIYYYLHNTENPEPIFMEFLLSPLIRNKDNRKLIISNLWNLLIKKQGYSKMKNGGQYCYVHRTTS